MLAKQKLTNDHQADGLADVYLFILSKQRQRLTVEKEITVLENFGKVVKQVGDNENNNKCRPRAFFIQNE